MGVLIVCSIRFLLRFDAAAWPSCLTTPLRSICSSSDFGGEGSRSRLIRCLAWKIDLYLIASEYFLCSSKFSLVQVVRNFWWKSSPNKGMSKRCDVLMMVDFPAPAHPATINNVSKSFFGGFLGCSMMSCWWWFDVL